MGTVQPVTHEFLAGAAFALCDLCFVMRENVVDAAAVNVDLIAEQCRCHRAALDMPTGTAAAPWTLPADIAILFVPCFPKCEVANVFLVVFVVFYAAGRLQLGEIEMSEFAVSRKPVDAEINRFVLGLISQATRNERANHLNHLVDITLLGRGGKFIRALDPQGFDVLEEGFLELRREFCERNSSLARASDRFVIHVGDVHDAMHFVTTQLKMALQKIFENVGAKISDVCAAVNGWAARIDVDVGRCRIPRPEFLKVSRVGIKKTECHFYE